MTDPSAGRPPSPPSDPRRWARVEELFHAALEKAPEERPAFLDSACGADADLRAEVERLLQADDDPGLPELGPGVAGLARRALEAGSGEEGGSWVGRSVGPYRVVRRLGQGGMGVVYLAERDDVRRRVALKVVRGSLAAPERVGRFLLERRVLARLAHPGIARLLDAGMDSDGTPWLAMDLVEGLPVTRYCEERGLDVRARLRLFLQVCDAVEYAHARLVVHRDIKPSNVLVDDAGRVKLLDFGIAKLLADEEGAEATGTGLRVFSPEYAAPEQVMGEPVTTATDVHALGVLLFELLSGQRPYRVEGPTPAAAVRALATSEPRRLSAVGRAGDRTVDDAAALTGDLEAICARALAREPGRRYGSARQLADDVSRHLDGYPVEARLPTLGYRVAKFVRRNRGGVAAAAAVVLALAAGLGASLWQGARARAALAESEAVAGFLAELFEASDPAENRGLPIGARDLLADGVRRIDELADQPRVQGRMLEVMARAHHGLGDSELAHELALRSLERRRSALGGDHPDVAETLHTLGEVLDELGDRDASVARFREALDIRRRRLGAEDDRTTLTMLRLARMLMLVGAFDEAEAMAREALEHRRAAHGARHPETAAAMESLALVLRNGRNDLETAEALLSEALAIREEAYGPDDPRIDPALLPLSTLVSDLGRPEEGEALVRRSVAIRRRVYGDDHPSVTFRLGSLGYVLSRSGRTEESEAVNREVVRRMREHYPGDYPYTATALNNLGAHFGRLGQHDSAVAYQIEARDMWIRLLGEETAEAALAHHNLGGNLARLGRFDEAEASIRRAWEVRRALHGEGSPPAMRTGSTLAGILTNAGKHAEAEEILREVLLRQRAHYPEGDVSVAMTLEWLAVAVDRQGRRPEMEPLLLEAVAILRRTADPDDPRRRRVVERTADFLEAEGRPEEAARLRAEEAAADAIG